VNDYEAEGSEDVVKSNRVRQIVRAAAITLNAAYTFTTGSSVVMMAISGVPVGAAMMAGLTAIPLVSLVALIWPPERTNDGLSKA
jgi:hypothetical protein